MSRKSAKHRQPTRPLSESVTSLSFAEKRRLGRKTKRKIINEAFIAMYRIPLAKRLVPPVLAILGEWQAEVLGSLQASVRTLQNMEVNLGAAVSS